jgi:hypothetical protein
VAKTISAAPIRFASPNDEPGGVAAATLGWDGDGAADGVLLAEACVARKLPADAAGPAQRVAKVAVTTRTAVLTCVTVRSKPPAVPQEPLLEVIVSVSRADI